MEIYDGECLLWVDPTDQKGCIITRGSINWCAKFFELITQERENPATLDVPEKEQ